MNHRAKPSSDPLYKTPEGQPGLFATRPLIAFRGLSKRFPGVIALREVSFEVPAGWEFSIPGKGMEVVNIGAASAMYYVWLARGHDGMREPVVGATADGRRAGEFFSSSLAPSPGRAVRGPFSVLQTFGKIDYRRICNGGPLTMELSYSLFRGRDIVQKMALFIRAFVKSGCQQLQLNTLNVDTLRDAQRRPELHRNLVVRVWGWSGYFCELDKEYQDQIIGRHIYGTQP